MYAEETHCWLCRELVDTTLPVTDPMARTVDHIVELWQGCDPLDRDNCALAHRRCNILKSLALRRGRSGAARGYLAVDVTSV